jgi:hypothetical protein
VNGWSKKMVQRGETGRSKGLKLVDKGNLQISVGVTNIYKG